VRSQHHPWVLLASPAASRQDIAHGVDLEFIGIGPNLFQDNGAHLSFVARYGAGAAQPLEQLDLFRANLRCELI
jgi:hypothetical protein